MRNRLPFALALTTAALAAQDAAPASPNPDHPAYQPLKALAGTWNCEVSGHGQKSTAIETAQLVCNGLFLKSVVDSTWDGKRFQGVSIWSYDPTAKHYVNVWVDSSSPVATLSTGTYDAKTKTWSAKSTSGPHGPTRSVSVWQDADTIVETTYATGAGGKEEVAMEITRRRGRPGAGVVSETASKAAPVRKSAAEEMLEKAVLDAHAVAPAAGHAELHRCVGKWDAVMTAPDADGKASETKGTEVVSSVCNGLWTWSDYANTLMGQKFEGHALTGFDPATKTYTDYWIDSMSPYLCTMHGKYDEKTKTLASSGTARGPDGSEMPMTATATWQDEHTRAANMTCGSGEHAMQMTVHYTRVHQEGAHEIK